MPDLDDAGWRDASSAKAEGKVYGEVAGFEECCRLIIPWPYWISRKASELGINVNGRGSKKAIISSSGPGFANPC